MALDAKLQPLVQIVIAPLAALAVRANISANSITLLGFAIGCLALPLIYAEYYHWALVPLLVNRLCDGVDGLVARTTTGGATSRGAFLDIACDFLLYPLIPLGFALADPQTYGAAAAFVIFSFIGTGSSFLAYASLAASNNIERSENKGLHYLGGLTEGAESIVFLALCCLFPQYFNVLAWGFGSLCLITTVGRFYSGYKDFS